LILWFQRREVSYEDGKSARYKNPWSKASQWGVVTCGPEFYETTAVPVEYRGYLIYERMETQTFGYTVFDVVKDGVCITQMNGYNGAKSAIDEILGGEQNNG